MARGCAEQRRIPRHGLLRQDVERGAGQRSGFQRRDERGQVDHRAARRVDEEGPALDRAEECRVHHAARLGIERRVQRNDVGLRGKVGERGGALDVGREVAVDEIRVVGNDLLEHVARDVRHPLADAPQAHDAQHQPGRAAHRSRRHEVPLARVDIAVVGHDVAYRGQCQRQRMRGDFADAVVRRIGDPDARLVACVGVDGVEARADPADDPQARQRGNHLGADRRILQQDPAAALSRGDHLLFGPALRRDDFDADRVEQRALEIDVGIVVVGVENLRHRRGKVGQRGTDGARKRKGRVAMLVKWPDRLVHRSYGAAVTGSGHSARPDRRL